MARCALTQERLKELITYDVDTGTMTWNSTGKRAGTKRPNVAGYYQVQIDGTVYLLHRLAFLYMTGNMPKQVVDHINRVSTDNRWCNLRDVSQQVNVCNKDARGYSFNKRKDMWEAYIQFNYKKIHLGYFDDEAAAIDARRLAETKYFK